MAIKRGTYRPRDPFGSTPAARGYREVLGAMAELATMPSADEIAAALGLAPKVVAGRLRAMERSKLVETFSDPDRPGQLRAVIAAKVAKRLGLVPSRDGSRWVVPAGVATCEAEVMNATMTRQELRPTATCPRGRPEKAESADPFAWVRDRTQRRTGLAMTLRALRSGWAMTAEDRGKCRAAMAWLDRSDGIRSRERPTVEAILAQLDERDRAEPSPAGFTL